MFQKPEGNNFVANVLRLTTQPLNVHFSLNMNGHEEKITFFKYVCSYEKGFVQRTSSSRRGKLLPELTSPQFSLSRVSDISKILNLNMHTRKFSHLSRVLNKYNRE